MRLTLLFIFIPFLLQSAVSLDDSESYLGYVIMAGDTLYVKFELPYSNIKQGPKQEKIQLGVKYYEQDELILLLPNEADEIGIYLKKDTLRFVSRYSNLKLGGRKDGETGLPKIFLRLEIEGDLTLYTAWFKIPDPEGGSWSGLPVLQRKGDILFKPPKLGFRKAMIAYLGECSGIDVALPKKEYNIKNADQLVEYYNMACAFK
ncbi:MAG: hypothetical protein ACI959_001844 [Limisphaerales bacterium]|jgi:hypothetical protein